MTLVLAVLTSTMISCSNTDDQDKNSLSTEQEDLIFPKGERITNSNFVGNAWLPLIVPMTMR